MRQWTAVMAVTVITVGSRCSLFLSCVACLSADPTLMVRTDIQGKYRDHLYTYEPADIEICKWLGEFGGGKMGGRRECCTPYLSGTWGRTEPPSRFLITSIFWQMTNFFLCERGLTERMGVNKGHLQVLGCSRRALNGSTAFIHTV